MITKQAIEEIYEEVNLDIDDRCARSVSHHEKSLELGKHLEALDFHFNNDSLDLKFGGDGDIGETLLYLFDCYFEMLDMNE